MDERVELRGLRWTVIVLFVVLVVGSEAILGLTLAHVVQKAQRGRELVIQQIQAQTRHIDCLIVEALGGNVKQAIKTCAVKAPAPGQPDRGEQP